MNIFPPVIQALIKRQAVTARSVAGLSAAALARIESGETPRRDVAWLLRARETAIQRSERKPRRRAPVPPGLRHL